MSNYQQGQLASPAISAQREPAHRLLSRRRVIGGLAGVTGVVVLGGGFAFWRYRQSQSPIYLYRAQGENINAVAWSPDGKRIAVASSMQRRIAPGESANSFSITWMMRIWDALTGHNMVRYDGENYKASTLVWSPNSRLIIPQPSQPEIVGQYVERVMDADTGATLLTYPKDAYPQNPHGVEFNQLAVAWSPDGKRIASAGISVNYLMQSWDALTGSSVISYKSSLQALELFAVAWSPDGQYLAATGFVAEPQEELRNKYLNYSVLQVWNALTGTSVFLSPPLSDSYESSAPQSCSWSPDSRRVVLVSNTTAQVWDIPGQKLVYTYKGHAQDVNTVAWSPDGKRIASGSDDESVQVWDAETGAWNFTYFGHSKAVSSLCWSPDSKYIVSGSYDGTVQVWLPEELW